MSDAFIYLALEQRVGFEPTVFPVLFVCTAAVYMVLAVPAGWLADRVGRTPVFLGGYALLLPSTGYCSRRTRAWARSRSPSECSARTTPPRTACWPPWGARCARLTCAAPGLALVGTATSVARLLASVIFGALWVTVGIEASIACFAGALLLALLVMATWLARSRGALTDA